MFHDHRDCLSAKDIDESFRPSSERPDLENKFERKTEALQQQLKRKKGKTTNNSRCNK